MCLQFHAFILANWNSVYKVIFACIISCATLVIKHHSTFTDEKLEFKKMKQLIQCAVIPRANVGPVSSNCLFH